jgi:hypothetical protein
MRLRASTRSRSRSPNRVARLLAGGHAVRAHDALLDGGDGLGPLVLGDLERAGHHAVTAAHALGGVVDDRAFLGLGECLDGTDGDARRVEAVHAEVAHVLVLAGIGLHGHVGVLLVRGLFDLGHLVVVGEAVLGGAGLLALQAADAGRRVIEDCFAHGFLPLADAARRSQLTRTSQLATLGAAGGQGSPGGQSWRAAWLAAPRELRAGSCEPDPRLTS